MAQSNTFSTAGSDLEKGYKKVASQLYVGFKRATEEYEWFDDFPEEEIEFSAREMLIPLDVQRGYGAAMIPEAGYEARTVSPELNEGTVTWVNMSQRFFISTVSKALDQRAKNAQIIRQVKFQSLKAVESMARLVGVQTYGFSTGVVCKTSTDATAASGQAYTLIDAYGVSTLDNAAYLASLFTVGQGVALIRAGALVTNAIGVVTAVNASTPSITVTWAGSVDCDANDQIVYANAVTDTTITASDYNRWPVGLLDAITSTSVHGLSSSTEAEWAAALNDSTGGRFSFIKLKKMRQALHNNGGRKLTDIIWANGVENDTEAGERAARVYESAQLDLDGSVKAKGVRFRTSALVPNGCVFGFDRDAYSKFSLMDKPDADGIVPWASMDKAEDRAGFKASLEFSYARMVRARRGLALMSGLTEQ